MSGKDVCLVFGTAAVCWMFGYYWTKRQTDKERIIHKKEEDTEIKVPPPDSCLTTTSASLSQSDLPNRTSAQLMQDNSVEDARLNGNDVEKDRVPDGRQWFDAVILHASKDEMAARLCQKILLEQVNVPNLAIGLPDDIITPGTSTLDGLASLLLHCRLVIIYHSRHMSMDNLMLFGKQANIMESLEDPENMGRIIPFIVDDEELSSDMCIIQSVDYIDDISSGYFTSFKNQMEQLFLRWREKL